VDRREPSVGVCGAAGRSAAFVRALTERRDLRLRYLCEPRGLLRSALEKEVARLQPDRRPGFWAQLGQANMYPMLEDPSVDGVIVVEDCELRPDLVAAALRAGKHVLAEEPLALTTARARALQDAALTRGLLLMTARSARADARRVRFDAVAPAIAEAPPRELRLVLRRRWAGEASGAAGLVEDLLAVRAQLGELQVRNVRARLPALEVELQGASGGVARLVYRAPAAAPKSPRGEGEREGLAVEVWRGGALITSHESGAPGRTDAIVDHARRPVPADLMADLRRFALALANPESASAASADEFKECLALIATAEPLLPPPP
jgi:hypothetical protein